MEEKEKYLNEGAYIHEKGERVLKSLLNFSGIRMVKPADT
jgi:hypothetical protein